MNVYLVTTYDGVLAIFSTFDDAKDFLIKNEPPSGNMWIDSMIVDEKLKS